MRTGLVKSLPGLPVRRPTVRRNGLSAPWWRCGMRNSCLTVRNTGERSCAALLISITLWSRTAVWTAIRRLRSCRLIFLNLWCKERNVFLHLKLINLVSFYSLKSDQIRFFNVGNIASQAVKVSCSLNGEPSALFWFVPKAILNLTLPSSFSQINRYRLPCNLTSFPLPAMPLMFRFPWRIVLYFTHDISLPITLAWLKRSRFNKGLSIFLRSLTCCQLGINVFIVFNFDSRSAKKRLRSVIGNKSICQADTLLLVAECRPHFFLRYLNCLHFQWYSQYIYLYKLIIITEYTMQPGNKVCGNKKAQRIYFTFNR